MTARKIYTLGNAGFVGSAVGELLGQAHWVRQARVLIAANSKAKAAALANEIATLSYVSPRAVELACGNDIDIDAILAAPGDVFGAHPVIALALSGGASPVVAVNTDGTGTLLGRYRPQSVLHGIYTPAPEASDGAVEVLVEFTARRDPGTYHEAIVIPADRWAAMTPAQRDEHVTAEVAALTHGYVTVEYRVPVS